MSEDFRKLAAAELPNLIDEKKLRCWFLNAFYSGCANCPRCGSALSGQALKTYLKMDRTSCVSCGRQIHIFQGTPYRHFRGTPEQFLVQAALAPLREEFEQLLKSISGNQEDPA